jgi:hypothetical protein
MRKYLAGWLAAAILAGCICGCGESQPKPPSETDRVKERCEVVRKKVRELKEQAVKPSQQAEVDEVVHLWGQVQLETTQEDFLAGEIPPASIKKMNENLDEIEKRLQTFRQ